MKIGILSCGHAMPEVATTRGDFSDMFAALLSGHGFTFEDYDVENMQFPANIHDCDGWLLTGSKHGAYEGHAFIPLLETFIRETYAAHVPMVGICFGHQIIAQALGGHVEKFDGGWAIGLTDYQFEGLGEMQLNAWHQDQVIRLPEGAKQIASNDFCENAALIYDDRILTVQPHPEFDGPTVNDYVTLRKGTGNYPDELMQRAANTSTQATSNRAMGDTISEFFKQPREVLNAS